MGEEKAAIEMSNGVDFSCSKTKATLEPEGRINKE